VKILFISLSFHEMACFCKNWNCTIFSHWTKVNNNVHIEIFWENRIWIAHCLTLTKYKYQIIYVKTHLSISVKLKDIQIWILLILMLFVLMILPNLQKYSWLINLLYFALLKFWFVNPLFELISFNTLKFFEESQDVREN